MLDALIVAPHPDDAELGASGGILKMQAAGLRVGVLDLTDGEPTPHGSPAIRAAETEAASALLDLAWRENLRLTNRALEPTIAARGQLAEVIRRTRPRWLFAPYWEDAHPDHVAATALIEAARFWAKLTKSELAGEPHHPERIWHYFCVHLRPVVRPDFVLDISDVWERKEAAIMAYTSQFVTGRTADPPLVERLREEAAFWGSRIGVRYGEPYACREPVGLTGFADLV